ncbi:hypothetical protein HKD37_06G016323 [Glycine soja]
MCSQRSYHGTCLARMVASYHSYQETININMLPLVLYGPWLFSMFHIGEIYELCDQEYHYKWRLVSREQY